ncbi:BON domain-containing protein [Caldimonas tepidiphila]|uniref:BON domain-containing protein n=1 Tax=Caldimonas tepidiphila TaxID=2315841 RepID=UPI000E5B6CF8|nr:BON domain-containing protein [Caldimonas tepidiphila]
MRNVFKPLVLSALGAAALYYLDPRMGRQRRALVRDKFGSMSPNPRDDAPRQGWMAEDDDRVEGMRGAARDPAPLADASQPTPERQLRERIRAELPRLVSRPEAIEVVVNQDSVSLRGQVLSQEIDALLSTVLAMPGVRHIDDRLERHDEPSSISAMLGDDRPSLGSSDTAPRRTGEAGTTH